MSLSVQLDSERVVVKQQAVTATLPASVKIERIVDIPDQKQVIVFVQGLGRVVLDGLSGDNYDQPAEWTNADVVAAVVAHIDSLV
jgi:hypothetical protein